MFEKCSCSHCSGNIEFNSEHAGQTVACPHCGLETKLYVPKVPLNKLPPSVSVEIKRGINPLGIASLVLGIGSCVFCWIPFLGLLVIPLAAIGLLLAVIGITAAIVGKKSSLSFPVSGAVVCVIATLIALFITGGISRLIVKQADQSNSTNQKSETSSGEESWSKSDKVQQGDIQITINAARINASVNPSGNLMKGDLNIIVNIENLNSIKIVNFEGWSGKGNVVLTDNFGNIYANDRDLFTPHVIDEYPLYPNKKANDFLSFLKPVENIQWLHLELPAQNFGGSGMIRFEIPASKITVQRW